MKKILIFYMLFTVLQASNSFAAVSGESLINIQDSTATGTLIQANRVNDAGTMTTDAITSGIMANGGLLFNGTNWDRMPGDKTNGLFVNIKSGGISGTITPADTFTNPTNATSTWSLNGVFNGTTWDRLRSGGDNSANPTLGKLYTLQGRANAAIQTFTEGNAVPASTDLQGNIRTTTIGSATIVTGQVTVDTTVGGVLVKAALNGRKELIIQNIGATDMYCGNTGVTITTGFKIAAGVSFVENRFNGAYYCIVGAGTTTAAYREAQ